MSTTGPCKESGNRIPRDQHLQSHLTAPRSTPDTGVSHRTRGGVGSSSEEKAIFGYMPRVITCSGEKTLSIKPRPVKLSLLHLFQLGSEKIIPFAYWSMAPITLKLLNPADAGDVSFHAITGAPVHRAASDPCSGHSRWGSAHSRAHFAAWSCQISSKALAIDWLVAHCTAILRSPLRSSVLQGQPSPLRAGRRRKRWQFVLCCHVPTCNVFRGFACMTLYNAIQHCFATG